MYKNYEFELQKIDKKWDNKLFAKLLLMICNWARASTDQSPAYVPSFV